MPSGLSELISKGTDDIFLTGTPEITFFKTIYRRYTEFSMENIEIPFNGDVFFGNTVSLTVPHIGDLLHKMYLKIKIPQISFTRNVSLQSDSLLNTYRQYYTYVKTFMKMNIEAYRIAYEISLADNIIYSSEIVSALTVFFGDYTATYDATIALITDINTLVSTAFELTDINTIVSNHITDAGTTPKEIIMEEIRVAVQFSKRFQKEFFDLVNTEQEVITTSNSEYLKFAWISNLGFSIVDYVDLIIGGKSISKHTADWLYIWYSLTRNIHLDSLFDKMIGNVSELTSFDRNVKPEYTLYIPLQFWFNRVASLALPIISIQHSDVQIDLKLKNFEDVAYIEDGSFIKLPNVNQDLYLSDLTSEDGITLEASLMIDYIYLGRDERIKFATTKHEYLIDQVQELEFNNLSDNKIQFDLEFNHPIKELIWIGRQESKTYNPYGYHLNNWFDYEVDSSNSLIQYSSINFMGEDRTITADNIYFNSVIPYSTHTNIPPRGINVYSFALYPEKEQPSGHVNLTRIDKKMIELEVDNSENYTIKLFARNMNIIRFINGMVYTAYVL